ncbi:MAG: DUF1329 domain-containing protein [Nitrospirae bacterium]|nr:DUF1329 domain-containing protein [Nitrospirota bacterium]
MAMALLSGYAMGGSAFAAELSPGSKIDKSNVSAYADHVPESVAKRVAAGSYALTIGEMKSGSLGTVYAKGFYDASQANKGKFKLDKEGGLISADSGKRENLPYGLPFPDLDPSDPDAGTKILWNFYATEFQNDSQEAMFVLRTLKGTAVEVEVIGKVARMNVDFASHEVKGAAKGLSYMENALYLAPADLFGTVTLTWRWQEAGKWDTTWAYSPSIRRVRRTSSANRSDPIGPTDFILDDLNGYSGKIEFMKWKLIEQKDMLLAYLPDDPQDGGSAARGKEPGAAEAQGQTVTFPRKGKAAGKYGARAFEQPRYAVRWGYDDPKSGLAAWWPLNWVFVKRPVYIVEGTSKDPYYSIGRQLLVIDRETNRVHMKLGWDRGGDFWRTQVLNQSYYQSPDGKISAAAAEISFVVDEKRNRASVSSRVEAKINPTVFSIAIEPSLFSSSNFLNYGK